MVYQLLHKRLNKRINQSNLIILVGIITSLFAAFIQTNYVFACDAETEITVISSTGDVSCYPKHSNDLPAPCDDSMCQTVDIPWFADQTMTVQYNWQALTSIHDFSQLKYEIKDNTFFLQQESKVIAEIKLK